jgi:hypothetical protein
MLCTCASHAESNRGPRGRRRHPGTGPNSDQRPNIEGNALLIPVDGEEVGSLVALERRREGTGIVTFAGPLNLDHQSSVLPQRSALAQIYSPSSFAAEAAVALIWAVRAAK